MNPWRTIALCLILIALAAPVRGQDYSVVLRDVDLTEALHRFADATGLAVAFDPVALRGHRVFCAGTEQSADELLSCLLRGTGLEYFRRASGTYVIAARIELPARYGLISGRVVNRANDAPITGAHVAIAPGGTGTVTDGSGRFLFDRLLPGRYVMGISHVGYSLWSDTLDVEPGATTSAIAGLRSGPVWIEPVVIEADRRPRSTHVAERTAFASPRIASLPGVTLTDAAADIQIQGSEAGEVLMRLDGVPVYLPRAVIGLIGPFAPSALSTIAVRKAGFDAGAGSRMSGVLEFSPRWTDAPGVEFQVDPYALEGTASGVARGGRIRGFLTGRTGFWTASPPGEVRSTLKGWSALDPFVLFAPLGQYDRITPTSLPDLANRPEPEVGFSDVHAGVRYRQRATHTWVFTAYRGQRSLDGARDALGFRVEAADMGTAFTPVSAAERYRWTNHALQIRLEAVVGGRALLVAGLRTSGYRFEHAYRLFDLVSVLGDITSGLPEATVAGPLPSADRNRIDEHAAWMRIDYVRGRHHIEAGAEESWTRTRFDLQRASIPTGRTSGGPGQIEEFLIDTGRASTRADAAQSVAWLKDRVTLGPGSITPSVRLTYRPNRATVYAEPRLRAEWTLPGNVDLTATAGLYRQFIHQLDLSVLDAGAFLPSTRIWLPLDGSLRPASSTHTSFEISWQPAPTLRLFAETYYKRTLLSYVLNYAAPVSALESVAQDGLLARSRGSSTGWTAGLEAEFSSARGSVRFTRSRASFSADGLFGDRRLPTPGEIPRQLTVSLDWAPATNMTLLARWEGQWDRSWALRRAYYDYFGHDDRYRFHEGFDLGDPGAHRRSTYQSLDLGVGYSRRFGPVTASIRFEALNVLDRDNELDRQLLFDGSGLSEASRMLPGRLTAVGLRMRW